MRSLTLFIVIFNFHIAKSQSLDGFPANVFINNKNINVVINKVVSNTLFVENNRAIYLKVVDSLTTTSSELIEAINMQGIDNIQIKRNNNKIILIFTNAVFQKRIQESFSKIIYRSFNFTISSIPLHNLGTQLFYSPNFNEQIVFSIGFDFGAYSIDFYNYAFSFKHGIGYTFAYEKINFIPMLTYSQKHQYRRSPVFEPALKNIDTWSLNMIFDTKLNEMFSLMSGFTYWFGNKRDINSELLFFTFFTGVSVNLNK
jgi:hypothetical protein